MQVSDIAVSVHHSTAKDGTRVCGVGVKARVGSELRSWIGRSESVVNDDAVLLEEAIADMFEKVVREFQREDA